jgi:arginyl-tRNA synthetase
VKESFILNDVFGSDHAGYLKRIKAAVSALSSGASQLEIKVCQMVNFLDNGEPVRMSKRAGVFITLKDVIDRVGLDATRYFLVSRHQDMAIDFDFNKAIEHSKDNPIFYIHYAHARICSVLRHMKQLDPHFTEQECIDAPYSLLDSDEELTLIRYCAGWPRLIEGAAHAREPHRIANGLYDLASLFHGLWAQGREKTHLRFIEPENPARTLARLGLILSVATLIKSGLQLLGISAIEEMR